MKEPVLRVLNMLKTVGQYDMNPPKGDKLARNIKQFWRKATIQDQEAAQSVLPQRSETSVKTTLSSVSTKTRPGLSPDAKNLEVLLRAYEESAKGWYKQQI
uniref:Uncharacterized protein n=1 Tax=Lygus hesperus TaxID=30085 RepID=A0A146LZL1_LYGHE